MTFDGQNSYLGGGLSGLTLGYFLNQQHADFIVLEKEREGGGLTRTLATNGYIFDYGGSHIIFSKDKEASDFMPHLLGKNKQRNKRNTKVLYKNRYVKYSFENDLASLPKKENFECLYYFIQNLIEKQKKNTKKPKNLKEWCYHNYGKGIAEKYLIPYNEKIWKYPAAKTSLNWVERIPLPPTEDIIKSSLGIRTEGYTHQLHFYYPRTGGIQSLTKKLEEEIPHNVLTNFEVTHIKKEGRHWIIKDRNRVRAVEKIISTIPVQNLVKAIDAPGAVRKAKRSTIAAACSKKEGMREDSLGSTRKKVREHFDDDASKRDLLFRDPIFAYEQERRQKAISSLTVGRNYPVCLDAGCGNGRDLSILSKRAGQVIGTDISRKMLEQTRPKTSKFRHRLDLLVCDLTYLPFRYDAVDLIVCSEVLEHVPNWRKAITEFYKALKPGGSIVISTPNKLSMYGLTRYPGRLFFGSKHPYDRWKSYFELGRALVSSNFQLSSSLEACYLPGDLSYYNPFKRVIIRLLNLIRSVEGKVSHKWPLNLLGFMIVVRGIKITVSMF